MESAQTGDNLGREREPPAVRQVVARAPARPGALSVKAKRASVKENVTVSNGVEEESKVDIIRRENYL